MEKKIHSYKTFSLNFCGVKYIKIMCNSTCNNAVKNVAEVIITNWIFLLFFPIEQKYLLHFLSHACYVCFPDLIILGKSDPFPPPL